eukprot:1147694-Pelagomonas_calceolata.AAC.10
MRNKRISGGHVYRVRIRMSVMVQVWYQLREISGVSTECAGSHKDGVQVPPFRNKGIGRCQSGIRPPALAWSLWPSAPSRCNEDRPKGSTVTECRGSKLCNPKRKDKIKGV